jgi:DNA anti-recombination protein RmuC
MPVIAFPSILTERLTDQGVKALADILDKVEIHTQQTTLAIAEERFEKKIVQLEAKISKQIAELQTQINNVRADLEAKIENVRTDLEAKIDNVRTQLEAKIDGVQANTDTKIEGLRTEIQKVRANMVMWMFIFWIGQISTITAILFAFFKP